MFTLDNVYENRVEFLALAKEKGACKREYKRALEANSKDDFMQVVYDNFGWLYEEVSSFGLKFDWCDDFYNGFARVEIDDKWGCIKKDGTNLVELKYDWCDNFCDGFADVYIGNKDFKIDVNGNEIY